MIRFLTILTCSSLFLLGGCGDEAAEADHGHSHGPGGHTEDAPVEPAASRVRL